MTASTLRVARPTDDLVEVVRFYEVGLGLPRLGSFEDHEGFDGVMLGEAGRGFHFEFTYHRTHPVAPSPTVEDLVVFYTPDPQAWEERCRAMLTAGFSEVEPFNPYWGQRGRTFEDPDGYRVVIERASWDS